MRVQYMRYLRKMQITVRMTLIPDREGHSLTYRISMITATADGLCQYPPHAHCRSCAKSPSFSQLATSNRKPVLSVVGVVAVQPYNSPSEPSAPAHPVSPCSRLPDASSLGVLINL